MPNDQQIIDQRFMARAIELARRGRYTTRPNPRVGCVLSKGDQLLAEGWHYRAGDAHAEVHALANLACTDDAKGATAYVTLEPCSHQGRTGTCTQALLAAGIARVVFAMEDPNPLVSGKGLSLLRDGGVVVDGPLLQAQSERLNKGFISRMKNNKPWVRCKMASSLDGRTAMANGQSQWITGAAARRDVQLLRAESCAIITGIGSIQHDDSRLTLREDELALDNVSDVLALHPIRVVVDSQLSISPNANIFDATGQIIIFTTDEASEAKANALLAQHAHLVIKKMPAYQHRVDIQRLLLCLAAEYECNNVLIEAGATLSGAFLQAGLIDECIIYQAPILLGHEARPLFNIPLQNMSEKTSLHIVDQRSVGCDTRITARVI